MHLKYGGVRLVLYGLLVRINFIKREFGSFIFLLMNIDVCEFNRKLSHKLKLVLAKLPKYFVINYKSFKTLGGLFCHAQSITYVKESKYIYIYIYIYICVCVRVCFVFII